jgi:replication factor A1
MDKEDLYRLLTQKGYCEERIEELIKEKREQIGPHITEDGLHAIIAAEHGVRETIEEPKINIGDIQPGLTNLSLLLKVIKVYEDKEFKKGDRTGKRQSILLGDRTGKIFLTLWDRAIEQYANKFHNGNVVRLLDVSSAQGPSGPQLRLGFKGRVVVEEENKYKDLFTVEGKRLVRKSLDEIDKNDRAIEVRATLSNIYRLTIYDSCPECNRSLIKTTNNYYYCEHCKIRTTPSKAMVLEIGIDDGSGHVRAVLFSDSASELIDESPDTIARVLQEYLDAGYNPKNVGLDYMMENKPDLMGREVLLSGSVNDDEFKGLVINVFDVKPIDYEQETKMIFKKLEDEFND